MAIVRPGPYICAEWEFGGLPWWLQTMEDCEIRCSNPVYIEHFENYLTHLFDQIRNARKGDTLTILVENMGRANFGPKMMRKKGIPGRLLFDQRIIHFNWQVYPLPMTNPDQVSYGRDFTEPTGFYKGRLTVRESADTFLYLDHFRKGFVMINGFNLGRYWEIGPQRSLYVPSSVLKQGENEIVIFETDGLKGEPIVEFRDYPTLG